MKQLLTLSTLLLFFSCGGNSKPTEKTVEEELIVADSIIQVMETQQQEFSNKTEETLSEVDSLLETL